jgi:hypothetical protein
MPNKIFISYRRGDSAANALGIGQYLENQFGRKNVFIDVDMRAGVKFPTVLEQRLAECKVMLALIGPEWLHAKDNQGRRRLDDPDDWVRVEIAQALKRDIAVVPVRVNGTELPQKSELPEDIRDLLDHQAVSVTTTGFRHEMAGLARDIRAIQAPRSWRRTIAVAAAILLLPGAIALAKFSNGFVERAISLFSKTPSIAQSNGLWIGTPGEWVLYEIGNQRFAHYFKSDSVRMIGNRAVYTTRSALDPTSGAVYQEDVMVIDCKKSIFASAERFAYNKAGEVMSHFRWGDPTSIDLSIGAAIQPGTVVSTAQHIMCDEQARTPLLSKNKIADLMRDKISNATFSYLSPSPDGAGQIFYGDNSSLSADDRFESLLFMRFYQDQAFTPLFPGQTIAGLPSGYRTRADRLQLDCNERKVIFLKTNYFSATSDLLYLVEPASPEPVDIKAQTPLDQLLKITCRADVAGSYEGMNSAIYKGVGQGEQKISIVVQQNGNDVTVSFKTADGGEGAGAGIISDGEVKSISLQSTAPNCKGSYEGSLKFDANALSWTFKGQDCNGLMEGSGTAKRTKT